MPRSTFRVILFLLWALAGRPSIASGQPYTFIYVPAPEASCELRPTDINNSQQIVGTVSTFDLGPRSCRGTFLWDPTTGLRLLSGIGGSYLGIDDAGVVYGSRGTGIPVKWESGTVSDLPMPPGAAEVSIRKVTNNGIVLMDAVQMNGSRTSWVLYEGTYLDLGALTGAKNVTINERGAVGGCTLLDPEGRYGRPYLRLPDGRVIEPWQTSCERSVASGVEVLGVAGHFAGTGFAREGGLSPTYFFSYYGTPDGRIWTAGPQRFGAPVSFLDMNSSGTALTRDSQTFREGTFINLRQATAPFRCEFYAMAINDAGYTVAQTCQGMLLLVPAAPAAPSQLSFTVSARVVALSWQQSVGASEYLVEAGSAPGLADLYLASVGAQHSLTTTAPPGRYYVRVRARSAGGLSAPSNEVVIAVP